MRVTVRGYGDGKLILTESLEVYEPELIAPIANRHLEIVTAYKLHMIEIEFMDEPDPLQRFMRFGTDPRGMVQPHEIGHTPS